MLKFLGSWAQAIVIAVVISTIIELILPDASSSKKYVKSVIGIFILFTILYPVTKVLRASENVNEVIENYEKEINLAEKNFERTAENKSSSTIKDIYISNLKEDLKKRLDEKGYNLDNSVIEIKDEENYEIKKMQVSISKKKSEQVVINEINISKNEDKKLDQEEESKIKKYISESYGVQEKNIEIL